MEAYLNALQQELHLASHSPAFLYQPISSIYIGGGTPSLLSVKQMAAVLDSVSKNFTVNIDAEVNCEANPGTISHKNLSGYKKLGINRLTLGVQSFVDSELKTLGRIHTAKQALKAFKLARSVGLDNIGVDLMFAVPGQNLSSWSETLSVVIKILPEHVSTYCLSYEPDTPFYQALEMGKIQATTEDDQREMYLFAIDTMESAGYEHYEISNFALPGSRSRHNQSYWDGTHYLGIGASSHSFDGTTRWHNIANVEAYVERIKGGKSVVSETEILTTNQKMIEHIMLGLRRREGIDTKIFEQHFAHNFINMCAPTIAKIERDWSSSGNSSSLVLQDDFGVRLSKEGFALYDEICLRFAQAVKLNR